MLNFKTTASLKVARYIEIIGALTAFLSYIYFFNYNSFWHTGIYTNTHTHTHLYACIYWVDHKVHLNFPWKVTEKSDPDNHDGVITSLDPDILECEVKWALGSITMNKASRSDGIPFELFQILKDDAVKVLHSVCQQIWKTQRWPQDWKRSVFIPIPKKGNAKECSNYCTAALISHTRKVMLKILQARLQQYMNHELPDVQAEFRKCRGTRYQIANIRWITKKAREF